MELQLSYSTGDSQESSPAPQFKDINSLVFCLLYGPALTTIHDHWEDHSLDYEQNYREKKAHSGESQIHNCF